MGKLEGKVAVVTGGSSGLALASAKLFVEEGAYVFITGRRQEQLDETVKLIGRNVTGVRGDAANLDDLDRLFDTVKREKGKIDVLFASAGRGEAVPLGEITEQHFDAAFGLNTRGTLFTVQKALPLFNDGGSIIMTGSVASVKGFPGFGVYAASKAALRSFARTWLNELKGRNKCREASSLARNRRVSSSARDTPPHPPKSMQQNCAGSESVWPRYANESGETVFRIKRRI
jgi:NAD(P)-dependent dehydrogenase (short-subunit alcohol dehydrogenase family)